MPQAGILIVEDEPDAAEALQNILTRLEYKIVAVVSSGEEAIKKTQELKPDLVLMDIILKGKIDGIEAAGEIRRCFNIPVVYMTGYDSEERLQRAKMTEPFGYLLKPFEKRELQVNIEMAIYKHKMEMKLRELVAVRAAVEAERKKAKELEMAYNQLQEKSQRLERFYRVSVDHEKEVVRLKQEVNSLLARLGQPKKYEVS